MDKHLASLLSDVLGIRESELHPELKKCDVGTWDSLKQMDLVVTLEKEYSITLDIPDIVKMVTMANIIQILQEKGVRLEN